jgi:outer membrane protein W
MSVVGQYHLKTEGGLKPYLGLGIGTIYDLRNTNMGLWTIEQDNWHFLLSPEAGLVFPVGPDVGLKLSAKYDYAFKTSSAGSFSNLNFNIGFIFGTGGGGGL